MDIHDAILVINKEFKELSFDYAEFNANYNDIELHFKGGKYFCLGHHIKPTLELRQILINPKFKMEEGK